MHHTATHTALQCQRLFRLKALGEPSVDICRQLSPMSVLFLLSLYAPAMLQTHRCHASFM